MRFSSFQIYAFCGASRGLYILKNEDDFIRHVEKYHIYIKGEMAGKQVSDMFILLLSTKVHPIYPQVIHHVDLTLTHIFIAAPRDMRFSF